jgi:hypothetical protein
MIEAKGYSGEVQFDGNWVTISRTRLIGRSTVGRGNKRIPLASIVSVQWKPATSMFAGFIQFETAGQGGTRSRSGRQTQDAMKDENSVVFRSGALPAFQALREAVEQALASLHNAQPQMAAPVSVADELTKLADLAQQGLLTQQEFEQQKARLLHS